MLKEGLEDDEGLLVEATEDRLETLVDFNELVSSSISTEDWPW